MIDVGNSTPNLIHSAKRMLLPRLPQAHVPCSYENECPVHMRTSVLFVCPIVSMYLWVFRFVRLLLASNQVGVLRYYTFKRDFKGNTLFWKHEGISCVGFVLIYILTLFFFDHSNNVYPSPSTPSRWSIHLGQGPSLVSIELKTGLSIGKKEISIFLTFEGFSCTRGSECYACFIGWKP